MRALSAFASLVRHAGGAVAEGFLVAALISVLALALSPVYAPAKSILGTGNAAAGSGRYTITVPNATYTGTTVVTIDPTTSQQFWVDGRCFQNGKLVWEQWAGTNSNLQATLTLGPTQLWVSGSASCTATANILQRGGSMRMVASTTFSAG